ncbi:hypothetical protein MYAM1_002817 [Malassezia yamatoensis]|uniref:F-box domain-containing protein n=1 Tax=Malassezia yamatoensis TaxID=253288 RepID=A0AAJ5YVB3_9BASI|nr:hypothetical protein MYAM1_002817 [Malassezia yamatoensis]
MKELPRELLEKIFVWLDPVSLAYVGSVCKAWHTILQQDAVWCSVALRLQYADQREARQALHHYYFGAESASTTGFFDWMKSFRDLCVSMTILDRHWGTHAAPTTDLKANTLQLNPLVQYYRPSGWREDVWRIKLDPYENCLIESQTHGEIRTVDIHTGQTLWAVSPADARPYPHLEFSEGWLVFDRDAPGHFEIWRSARLVPDLEEANRGEFIRYTILDVPEMVRAYRLQFPTLAFVTINDTYAEIDIRTKSITRQISLESTLHVHRNINYIEFDDQYLFLVGFGYNRVSILRRDSGEVLWTLAEHIQQHGPPECYRSAPLRTDDRHALLLREQVLVDAPRWLEFLAQWSSRDPAQLCYSWHAVHFDRDTETLVVLGESGILLLPNYKAMLRGEPCEQARMHLFATERDSRLFDEELAEDLNDALNFRRRPRAEMHGQLSVANGRVVSVFETLTVLDLHTTTQGRDTAQCPKTVPFAVYEWSDMPNAFDWYTGPIDQFRGCSCVQMDATSFYCITRQSLDREINIDRTQFTDEYQENCVQNDSSMVTGYHFDHRSSLPIRLDKATIQPAQSDDLNPRQLLEQHSNTLQHES